MTTQEIYTQFDVPKNLQQHMLRVAGLVQELKAHWAGEDVDWMVTTQAALLHDIANVIKFDLDRFPELLGQEEFARIDYWREKQRALIQRYGEDEHEAGEAMLAELGVPDRVRKIISQKSFCNAKEVNASSDLPTKILLYSDLRILPHGLGSLQARLEDVRQRLTKYSSRPDFPDLIEACQAIERTIQASLSSNIDGFVTQTAIDSWQTELLSTTIQDSPSQVAA